MKLFFVVLLGCSGEEGNDSQQDSSIVDSSPDFSGRVSTDSDWADVQAGYGFTCGLRLDGGVECWSCFDANLQDDFEWTTSCQPPEGSFQLLSTSGGASCALDVNGEIDCWGVFVSTGAEVPSIENQKASHISVDGFNYCWADGDGVIQCRGGTEAFPYEQQVDLSDLLITSFETSYYHVSALTEGGDVIYLPIEDSDPIQLTDKEYVHHASNEGDVCAVSGDGVDCWNLVGSQPLSPLTGEFLQVDVGLDFACAVSGNDSTALCWGRTTDDYGQMSPPKDTQFKKISTGGTHACGVRLDGHIECWGYSESGATSPP